MSEALSKVVEDADFWVFHVERSQLDWGTGTAQSPRLVIRKGEPIELSGTLDPRLVKSKRVRLIASWKDGGTIDVNLTRQTLVILIPSDSASQKMKQFNTDVVSGVGSRWLTPGTAGFLSILPLLVALIGYTISYIADRNFRRVANTGDRNIPYPPSFWFDHIGAVAWYTWPLTLAGAIAIVFIRVTSGGLRIRREVGAKTSILSLLYKLRTQGFRFENMRQVIVGVLIGVGVALLTTWFVRK